MSAQPLEQNILLKLEYKAMDHILLQPRQVFISLRALEKCLRCPF